MPLKKICKSGLKIYKNFLNDLIESASGDLRLEDSWRKDPRHRRSYLTH